MKKKSKSIITNSSFQYKTPLRTDHSSDKINYISWRKTCLRKCVDYKCGIASTADSPESANENDHFDEIRNFMHKVTPAGVTKFGGAGMRNMFRAEDMSSVINPDEKEKGGDGLESEGNHRISIVRQSSPSALTLCLKSKMDNGEHIINNNSQEAISTSI